MDYLRAFWESATKIPWWGWLLFIAFDFIGVSAIGYWDLFRGLDPRYQSIVLVVILIVSCLMIYKVGEIAWQKENAQRQHLLSRLAPHLDILFDLERFPSCRMEWPHQIAADVPIRLFRVAVKNTSMTSIDNLRVWLDSFDPQGARFLPVQLTLMNDRSEGHQWSREGMTVNPDDICYADVALKPAVPDYEIQLCYAIANLPNTIPARRYRLKLRATGRDVAAREREFILDVDENGGLIFQAVTNLATNVTTR